jgi:ATP phosphoribosyltransferase regulatory subunit
LENELFEILQRKSRSEVEGFLSANQIATASRRMLSGLLDLSGGPEVLAQARELLRDAPKAVQHALDELQSVMERVARYQQAPELYFDLAELSGYHYYTGVVFSAFVPGYGRAIARGGRYDGIGRAFGRDRAATGFGADLRQWLRLSIAGTTPITGILVSDSMDSAVQVEVARLRGAGERVVLRFPGDKSSAAEFGCDRVLISKNGRWTVEPV